MTQEIEEDFFEKYHEKYFRANRLYDDFKESIFIEELYQAFKKRYELESNIPTEIAFARPSSGDSFAELIEKERQENESLKKELENFKCCYKDLYKTYIDLTEQYNRPKIEKEKSELAADYYKENGIELQKKITELKKSLKYTDNRLADECDLVESLQGEIKTLETDDKNNRILLWEIHENQTRS